MLRWRPAWLLLGDKFNKAQTRAPLKQHYKDKDVDHERSTAQNNTVFISAD